MIGPSTPTDEHIELWQEDDGCPPGVTPQVIMIGGPEEGPDVVPCPAIVSTTADGTMVIHVAWQIDEVDLARLAHGGTLWLTTYSGLPVHRLEVTP